MSNSYPPIMHAQGYAKTMLKWFYSLQDDCSQNNMEGKYLIPEEIFSMTPNYVFRKFVKTRPWQNIKCRAN